MTVLLIYFYNIVIQGTADVSTKLTQDELSKTVDFCFKAFQPAPAEQREAVLEKLKAISTNAPGSTDEKTKAAEKALESALSEDEMRILTTIRARQMLRSEDVLNMDNFAADVIDGLAPNLVRGDLGLAKPTGGAKHSDVDVRALMIGEEKMEGEEKVVEEVKENQIPISTY